MSSPPWVFRREAALLTLSAAMPPSSRTSCRTFFDCSPRRDAPDSSSRSVPIVPPSRSSFGMVISALQIRFEAPRGAGADPAAQPSCLRGRMLGGDRDRTRLRLDLATLALRECPSDFRAEEEDDRRVVGPHEQDDQRARRAVRRADAAAAEIEADAELPEREEDGGHDAAEPCVARPDPGVRQRPVEQREGGAEDEERDEEVARLEQDRFGGAEDPFRARAEDRRDRGRDEQEEEDGEQHPEGDEPLAQ